MTNDSKKENGTTPQERLIKDGDYPVEVGYISPDTRRMFYQQVASIRVREKITSTFEKE